MTVYGIVTFLKYKIMFYYIMLLFQYRKLRCSQLHIQCEICTHICIKYTMHVENNEQLILH